MSDIPSKQKKLTEPEWRELCTQWENDARTQKQFCIDNNINYAHFICWRSRLLSERGQSRIKKFKPVAVKPAASPSNQDALVLKMPNGIVLQIPSGIHQATLSITLEMLGVKSC